jgi:hypothetical protein
VLFNHKYSRTGQGQKLQERSKREDQQRKYKHGENISL